MGGATMTEFSIVPGESIGPFKLGMTRQQSEDLEIRPRVDLADKTATHFPLVGVHDETCPLETVGHPHPGVDVHYMHRAGVTARRRF